MTDPNLDTDKLDQEQVPTKCLLCAKPGLGEFTCPEDNSFVSAEGTLFASTYLLKSKLAAGGYGAVFECEHVTLKKKLAIKILHGHMLKEKDQLLRFQREARILNDLKHENIVQLIDHGWTPRPYIAMEYLEGQTLQTLLARGPLPAATIVHIFGQVCLGLASAHAAGITHRDLKPSNISIEGPPESGLIKVLDFGISKIAETSLTATGEALGSPSYMSPEQCLGEQVDQLSDIYALGCLLYESFSGQPPFSGDSHLDILRKHIMVAPEPLSNLIPSIPPELEQLVMKCLAKDRESRFPDALAVREALLSVSLVLVPKKKKHRITSLRYSWQLIVVGCAWLIVFLCSRSERLIIHMNTVMTVFMVVAPVTWLICVYNIKQTMVDSGFKVSVSPLGTVGVQIAATGLTAAVSLACGQLWFLVAQELTLTVLTLGATAAVCASSWSIYDCHRFAAERRGVKESVATLLFTTTAATLQIWSQIPTWYHPATIDSVLKADLAFVGLWGLALTLISLVQAELGSYARGKAESVELTARKAKILFVAFAILCTAITVYTDKTFTAHDTILIDNRDGTGFLASSKDPTSLFYQETKLLNELSQCKYPQTETNFGWACLAENRFEDALTAFNHVVSSYRGTGSDFLGHATAVFMLHPGDEATTEEGLLLVAASHSNGDWPKPAMIFLAGKLSREEMIQKCPPDCQYQAFFYSGIGYLKSGHPELARAEFKKCRDSDSAARSPDGLENRVCIGWLKGAKQ